MGTAKTARSPSTSTLRSSPATWTSQRRRKCSISNRPLRTKHLRSRCNSTRSPFKTAVPKRNRDLVYLAIDRELAKEGKSEEKFARKKKGDLGWLPTTKNKEEL